LFVENLKSGAKVQVQRPGENTGYMCKVEVSLPDDKEVLIQAPVDENKPVTLKAGEKFNLRLFTDNATFSFKTTVLRHKKLDGLDVVCLSIDDDGVKTQRRSAFRFNCGIPVTFNVVYSSGQPPDRDEGIISDLSAGGSKITTNKSLDVGYLLTISIPLGDDIVVAFGDVRSKTELTNKSKYAFQYGIRFTMMPESDQEKIIRFMYKMQREELKKARPR